MVYNKFHRNTETRKIIHRKDYIMKKITKIMSLFLVLMLVFASCGEKQADGKGEASSDKSGGAVIKVALADDYAPMEYRDENNELVGFDIDFIKALEKELGMKIEIVTMAWDGLFVGLENDKHDMVISAVSITPERLESYEMSKPYLASGQVVVVNKNNVDIAKAEDMAGKKIGVQTQSTGEAAAMKQNEKTPFELTSYDDVSAIFNDIKTGRLDGSVVDYLVAMEYVAKNPDDYDITNVILSNEPLAVCMKKGNADLKAKVEDALKKMQENGELKKISEKWFEKDYTSNIDEKVGE